MFAPESKLICRAEFSQQRTLLKQNHRRLVVTNGCFDLLHVGHVRFLQQAAQQGDALWVGINSDASVKRLKGPLRPIYPQNARVALLSALACIDAVFVFEGTDLAEELAIICPDIYVKAGDYTLESLNKNERQALEDCHASIRFLKFIDGWSTTTTIQKIRQSYL